MCDRARRFAQGGCSSRAVLAVLAGPVGKGAMGGDQDAAAVGGLGAVVVQSERDVNVRPRAAVCSGRV
jgi:hypothetical protein